MKRRLKKLVFVEPKSTHLHVYSKVCIPRLGSVLLGTILRNKGYDVRVYIEDVLPHVVKRDGRREPFDRQKLRGSILKACEKRSVGVQAVEDVVADIEARLHDRAEKEISSLELGELVMEHLQRLDQVAYARFASVYRQFKDIAQFMDEVKGLLKEDGKAKPGAPKPRVLAKSR